MYWDALGDYELLVTQCAYGIDCGETHIMVGEISQKTSTSPVLILQLGTVQDKRLSMSFEVSLSRPKFGAI